MPYKDPERQRAALQEWKSKHPGKMAGYRSTYEKKHPGRVRSAASLLRKRQRERDRLASDPLHRAKRIKSLHAYFQTHPGVREAHRRLRRARLKNAPINDLTHAQWLEIQAAFDHRCVYCHKRRKGHLTQDHIIPLSKGGSHTYSNVVPACRSCNTKKLDRAVLCPIQPLLLTVAQARVANTPSSTTAAD